MQTSKFNLADVICLLSAIIFGFICFLSLNFLLLGDTSTSILWAVLIAFTLFFLAYGVRLLKARRRYIKSGMIWEGLLLIMFLSVAFFSFFPFSHLFTVLGNKEEIYINVSKTMDRAKEMFNAYETYTGNRLDLYKSALSSAVATKFVNSTEYQKLGFIPEISDTIQIKNKMDILNRKIMPEEYRQLKTSAMEWLENADKVLKENWAFTFEVIDLLNILEPITNEWNDKLRNFSSYKAQGETYENFEYKIEFNLVYNLLTEPVSKKKPIAFIIAILLYLLMLFSFFIADRNINSKWKNENEINIL
jgi:hypothetical protein